MNPNADAPAPAPVPLPDLPPSVGDPASPAPASPPHDGTGAGGTLADAGLLERIDRASDAAVSQHLSEQPAKRRHGQRGPDRNPGSRPTRARGLPLAPVAPVADAPLLADQQPTPLEIPPLVLPPCPPPFDRDTAQEMAGFLTEFLNDFAGVAMESWALKHLGDAQLAADAGVKARMADKLQSRWEKSLVKLAEKHRIALEMAPEVIAGGCLLLWGSNMRKQAIAIKLKGAELRAGPVQAAAA